MKEMSRKWWHLVSLGLLLSPPPTTQSFQRARYPEPSSSAPPPAVKKALSVLIQPAKPMITE